VGDNHPQLFWLHLLAALQAIVPDAAPGAVAILQAPQPPPMAAPGAATPQAAPQPTPTSPLVPNGAAPAA